MDPIINLLQQLAISLTPTEFIIVLIIIAGVVSYIFRFIFKSIKGENFFSALLLTNNSADENKEDLKNISKNIELLMTTDDFDKKLQLCYVQLQKIISLLEQDISKSEHKFELLHQLTKQEVERRHIEHKQDILDLKQIISKLSLLIDSQTNTMRVDNTRLFDIIQRLNSHIENIEEMSKSAIPEFRNYHRDLSSELKDISNDIALVERSIQNQINISNAIKLR